MAKKGTKGKKRKQRAAEAARAYEAAMSTPARRHVIGAGGSQDAAADRAGTRITNWGRYLDENHDLASGVLDEFVKGAVGRGIMTIPAPLRSDGSIDEELGRAILAEHQWWTRAADVSGELSWGLAQRLICRAWARDGESFIQHVAGRTRGYPFEADEVPYRIELIESDLVPWDLTRDGWRQGIQHDRWGRPIVYAVLLQHPEDLVGVGSAPLDPTSFRSLPREVVSHLKMVKRWPATRGISVFAPTIARLYDVKDLEDSERIKNRILASWAAAIIRAPDMPGHEQASENGRRFTEMFEGTLIDTLAPGETIEGVGPDYPVQGMPEHIADQIRRVAAGTGTRYSNIAKKYDGSYSAQRQEMVETEGAYQIREDQIVSSVIRPCYERWLLMLVGTNRIRVPAGMTLQQLMHAEYRGPVTPWIDPQREVQADKIAVDEGFITLEQVQIRRGMDPARIGERPERTTPEPAQLSLIDEEEEQAA